VILVALVLPVAGFVVGDRLGRVAAGVVLTALLALTVGIGVLTDELHNSVWLAVVLLVPAWSIGRLARGRRLRADEVRRLNELLVSARSRAEALAAEAERSRIAREMHDALSHGLSLMTLQAAAGPSLLESDPDGARQALASIAASGEAALAQLDALVGDVPWPQVPGLLSLSMEYGRPGSMLAWSWSAGLVSCRRASTS
jgi:signal transduction histidine kinase